MTFVVKRKCSELGSVGKLFRLVTLGCIASSTGACGGSTPHAVAQGPQQQSASPPPIEKPEPEPETLFFIARIKDPRGDVARIAEWCNLPFDLDDALSELGSEVPKSLRFDLPIDIAVSLAAEQPDPTSSVLDTLPEEPTLDPQLAPEEFAEQELTEQEIEEPPSVHSIVSIGVDAPGDLVRALKTQGKTVQEKEQGQYVVELDDDLSCVIGPSRGPTAHRLTCGMTAADLDALTSYAARRLVTEGLPNKAFYAEIRFAPLRARFGDDARELKASLPALLQEMRLGNQRFDKALEDTANAVANEAIAWVDGVNSWNFSAEFPSDRATLLGESTLRFENADGYVANLLRRTASAQKPAPELFWDLPREVDSATFNTRAPVTASERQIAATLTELLVGGLEYAGVATGPADAWSKSVRELLESGGTMVVASGRMPNQAKAAAQKSAQTVLDAFGYYLIGVEGDASALSRALRTSVSAFNDKRLRSAVAKKFEEDVSKLPLVRSRVIAKSKTAPPIELFSLTFPIPKSELPKHLRGDKFAIHLAMTTVGERTWFGFAFSEAEALNTVRTLVDGTDYPKLATHQGLASLRSGHMMQGSFFTLNSYAKMFAGLPLGADDKPLGDELVRALPHGGVTPIVFTLSTVAEGPAVTARWELPREIFDDGSALTLALIAAFGSNSWTKDSAPETTAP